MQTCKVDIPVFDIPATPYEEICNAFTGFYTDEERETKIMQILLSQFSQGMNKGIELERDLKTYQS